MTKTICLSDVKGEDSGSLYDQFNKVDTRDLPAQPEIKPAPVREANWQANRADMSKPYNNKEMPEHAKEAMNIAQVDHSYYAFTRFMFGHPVRDTFEAEVNKLYVKPVGEFSFTTERGKYVEFYRSRM